MVEPVGSACRYGSTNTASSAGELTARADVRVERARRLAADRLRGGRQPAVCRRERACRSEDREVPEARRAGIGERAVHLTGGRERAVRIGQRGPQHRPVAQDDVVRERRSGVRPDHGLHAAGRVFLAAMSAALCARDTMPAGNGALELLPEPSRAAAPVAVLSLFAIVLLLMTTLSASCSAMPPPASPVTLLTMMLFRIWIDSNWPAAGIVATSWPLMNRSAMPPPSPEPELLPWIRLRRTCTGPEPADSATAAPACGSWPAIRMPPPLPPTPTVWSKDWLNRILLSAMRPPGLRP